MPIALRFLPFLPDFCLPYGFSYRYLPDNVPAAVYSSCRTYLPLPAATSCVGLVRSNRFLPFCHLPPAFPARYNAARL